MLDQSPARTSGKNAPQKRVPRRGAALGWGDVLRAVQRDAARAYALDLYRAGGYSADDFAHVRAAREAMSDALARTEDWIEMQHAAWRGDRETIRDVRRSLEVELFA
jgi:hypothetical protein